MQTLSSKDVKPLSKTLADQMTRFYRALFTACDRRNCNKIRDLINEYLTRDDWQWKRHPIDGMDTDMQDLMHRAEQMIGM